MTALFLDGFDHYGAGVAGATNMLAGTWAAVPLSSGYGPGVPSYGTRTGLYSLAGGYVSVPYRYVPPGGAISTVYMSFGYSVQQLPLNNNTSEIVSFCTSANVPFACLVCQADGSLALLNQINGNTTYGVTSGPVIVPANWNFIELEFNPSAGVFILRLNDPDANLTPVMSISGASFGSTTTGQFTFMQNDSGNPYYPWMDDLFIRDATGTTNNGWLGDRRIATLLPDSNTTTQGWTPSYYKEFGSGILRLAYAIPGTTAQQNTNAYVNTNSSSSLDIGSNAFTLETMIRFDQLPSAANYSTIFSYYDTSANHRSYRFILGGSSFNGGCLQFDTSTDGTSSTNQTPILYPWTPLTNVWYHLALVRVSNQLLLFVNGQQLGLPITDTRTYFSGGSQPFAVGIEDQAAGILNNTNLVGRLDETRFTNGVGRYTGPFTPPSAAFPRGSSDPDWAQVVLLMGYDSAIVDESSFVRSMNAVNGALAFQPSDGPTIGQYSTIAKATPDDNTFISASLTNATNIFTMTVQPANGNTVTVGTKNGSTAAVYTFKTTISTAFDVLIDTTAQNTLTNLLNAINAGAGSGTKYGAGTTSNYDVNATQLPAGQFQVNANIAGTAGNSIACSTNVTGASWATATLTGGLAIPGPSEFKFQRPPNNTTIVSALQMTMRGLKTDAGTATIQDTFIGALGGTAAGATHNLTVSPIYYNDIIQTDPDTGGALTPTTITNGTFEINRTA